MTDASTAAEPIAATSDPTSVGSAVVEFGPGEVTAYGAVGDDPVGLSTDLIVGAAGVLDGTFWSASAGLGLIGLRGSYDLTLLLFASSELRSWFLDLEIQEIERRSIESLPGTLLGDPEYRWATIASREPSATRLGSAFRAIDELAGESIDDLSGRIGGDGGAVGRNTLCRVFVSWYQPDKTWSKFEPWEPQTRDAQGIRVRLELWRLSTDFEIRARALAGVAVRKEA